MTQEALEHKRLNPYVPCATCENGQIIVNARGERWGFWSKELRFARDCQCLIDWRENNKEAKLANRRKVNEPPEGNDSGHAALGSDRRSYGRPEDSSSLRPYIEQGRGGSNPSSNSCP